MKSTNCPDNESDPSFQVKKVRASYYKLANGKLVIRFWIDISIAADEYVKVFANASRFNAGASAEISSDSLQPAKVDMETSLTTAPTPSNDEVTLGFLSSCYMQSTQMSFHLRQITTRTSSPQKGCPDILVIDSRGSGGHKEQGSPPSEVFVQKLRQLLPQAWVKTIDNPYPAVPILPTMEEVRQMLHVSFAGLVTRIRVLQQTLNGLGAMARNSHVGAYHDSVVVGKKDLRQLVAQQVNSCGSANTKLLLVGYSQGAQVTGDVIQSLPRGQRQHIFGTVLFGDPRYNHASFADVNKRDNNGILPVRSELPGDLRSKVLSYCHGRDPVCQGLGQWVLHGAKAHETYNMLGEPEQAAQYFARLVSNKKQPGGQPQPNTNGADRWPTERMDDPPALAQWLGSNYVKPSWAACNANYCIVGQKGGGQYFYDLLVYVIELSPEGAAELGEVWDPGTPRVELSNLQVPDEDINQVLSK